MPDIFTYKRPKLEISGEGKPAGIAAAVAVLDTVLIWISSRKGLAVLLGALSAAGGLTVIARAGGFG